MYAKDASIEGRITIGELYYTEGKTDSNGIYLGCMIIKTEGADGQISGALSTTGDTAKVFVHMDMSINP